MKTRYFVWFPWTMRQSMFSLELEFSIGSKLSLLSLNIPSWGPPALGGSASHWSVWPWPGGVTSPSHLVTRTPHRGFIYIPSCGHMKPSLLFHFIISISDILHLRFWKEWYDSFIHFSLSMSKPCDKYIHHYFQFPMWLDCILCQITIILSSVHYYIHNKNCVNANTRTKNELYVKIFFQIHKFICKDKYISCLWAKSKSWTLYIRHRLHLSNLVEWSQSTGGPPLPFPVPAARLPSYNTEAPHRDTGQCQHPGHSPASYNIGGGSQGKSQNE